MEQKVFKLKDFAQDVSIAVKDAQASPYDRFVGLEHYDSGEPVITRFTDTSLLSSSVKEFHTNDILIARRNVYLRRAGIAFFDGLTSGDSIVLRIYDDCNKRTGINKEDAIKIIPFILNSNHFWAYANKHADGMNSKRISKEMLYNYEFTLPSIEDMKLLADKLWSAYRLKESYKKLLAATEEMVKSQFIEMFGNQDINDRCWKESIVKNEFKLTMGKTPARNNPNYWQSGSNKWVSISDMAKYGRYTGDTQEKITDKAISESGIKVVPKGTIIMSFKLSIGRTALTSEDIYTNEAIMAFRDVDESKFNLTFLQFLIANKNWLLNAKQAVKGQTLNKDSIGNSKIITPPLELQKQFADIYNQADKSGFELRKSIDAIDAVIKSLINN